MITRRRIIRRLLAAGRTQDEINGILADLKMRPFGLPEFKDPPPAPNWDRWMMLRRPQDWKIGKTIEEIIQIEKQFGIYGQYPESGQPWPPPFFGDHAKISTT